MLACINIIYGELFRQDLSSDPAWASQIYLQRINDIHTKACTMARGIRRSASREHLKRIRCRLSTLRWKLYSEFIVKTRNPWQWRRLLVWRSVEGWEGADVGLSLLFVFTSGTLRFGWWIGCCVRVGLQLGDARCKNGSHVW